MPPVEKHLAISVLTPTRPRFAQDLLRAIQERGCTVAECRFAMIGDRTAASLLVTGNWSALGKLETAMPGVAEQLEMQVLFSRCDDRGSNPEFRPYAAEVIAPQQPDLLTHLLEFFYGQGVEIADIVTQNYASTYTGAEMYSVQMVLHVPVSQHPQALRESFMDLCDDLNADGMLDPIKS